GCAGLRAKDAINSHCIFDRGGKWMFRSQAVIRRIDVESLFGEMGCVGSMRGGRAGEIATTMQVKQHRRRLPRFGLDPFSRNTSHSRRCNLNAGWDFERG